MNILIFAGYYHPYIGGYAKNIHELAKRLVTKGYHVRVLTCNTEKVNNYEIKDGVIINRIPCWHLLGKTFPVPMPNLQVFAYSADVVITQTRFFPICFMGMLFTKLKGLPLIHVERGTCHSVVSNRFVNVLARVYDHTLGTLIVRLAKVNIGISNSACDFIKHIGGKKPLVIYNGISHDKYPIEGLKQLIAKDLRIIVFVGRLIYAKGVQDLIQAFNICRDRYKDKYMDLQLVIVGDGNYKGELEKLASKSEYVKDIKFLGQNSINEISSLLSIAMVFVNPSYSEGLPTSVMEAASFGLPIIATDVGGTNEIIEQCKSGILIKPNDVGQLVDELDILIKSKEVRDKLGQEAIKTVRQKFDWDTITNQWIYLLNSVGKPGSVYLDYMSD